LQINLIKICTKGQKGPKMATKGCRGLPKALHSLKLLNFVKIAIKGNKACKGQLIPLDCYEDCFS